jgi:hypothetical protein
MHGQEVLGTPDNLRCQPKHHVLAARIWMAPGQMPAL